MTALLCIIWVIILLRVPQKEKKKKKKSRGRRDTQTQTYITTIQHRVQSNTRHYSCAMKYMPVRRKSDASKDYRSTPMYTHYASSFTGASSKRTRIVPALQMSYSGVSTGIPEKKKKKGVKEIA